MPIGPTPPVSQSFVVIAAHGAPAVDYPRARVGLLMALEMTVGRLPLFRQWQHALDRDVRNWPRTATNDPYKTAVDDLAERLSTELGCQVFAGYNEFCSPTLSQALDTAAEASTAESTVLVVPTMLLRGNQHTEEEIRQAVAEAQARHPQTHFYYAWPFSDQDIVRMFANHLRDRAEALKVT